VSVGRWVFWGAVGLGTLVLGREVYLAFGPNRRRRRYLWQMAQDRARLTGKRLIVIGDPDSNMVNRIAGRDYDCGDLCVDTFGCPACPAYISGRLDQILPHLQDNSAVIYITTLAGDVGDMTTVMLGLDRVSGGDLFVASGEPLSIAAYTGHRRILLAPPDAEFVEYKPVWWHPEPVPAPRYRVMLPNVGRRARNEIAAHGTVIDERNVIDVPIQGQG
jgi:hypothetical protein